MFKYGIKDKCQNILLPDKKQSVNEGLVDLSLIPGSFDSFSPHLSRSSSAVAERIRKSSFPGYRANEINPTLGLSSYIGSCYNSGGFPKAFSENVIIDEWIRGNPKVIEA